MRRRTCSKTGSGCSSRPPTKDGVSVRTWTLMPLGRSGRLARARFIEDLLVQQIGHGVDLVRGLGT
jgi:hypothetical protein